MFTPMLKITLAVRGHKLLAKSFTPEWRLMELHKVENSKLLVPMQQIQIYNKISKFQACWCIAWGLAQASAAQPCTLKYLVQ